MWKETERMIDVLKFNPSAKDRDAEWDAVITLRQWIMKAMQKQMTDAEFCKVVGF
jgi:myo-inositol-1-phosphate synthase